MGSLVYHATSHANQIEYERNCFLVFSTRAGYHVNSVVESLSDLLSNELKTKPIKIDEARVAGRLLLPDIIGLTKECDLGIVILDGLRPNVILELGMLLAHQTPCIILLEKSATIDIRSLAEDIGLRVKTVPKMRVDVQKHLSDISNISWNTYSSNNELETRQLVRKEMKKLEPHLLKKKGHDHSGFNKKIHLYIKRLDDSRNLTAEKHSKLIKAGLSMMTGASKSDKAHIYFHIAQSYCIRREFQVALRKVNDGLRLNPNSTLLLGLKVIILTDLEQKQVALKLVRHGLRRNPKSRSLIRAYLHVLFLNGRHREIIRELAKLSYEELLMKDLFPMKAHALRLLGKYSESIALYLDMYEYDSNVWAIEVVMNMISEGLPIKLPQALANRIIANARHAWENKHIKCFKCFFGCCRSLNCSDLRDMALEEWRKKLRMSDPEEVNVLAFSMIEAEQFEQARIILNSGLRRFRDHSYLNATFGLYKLTAEQDLIQGRKYYLRAIELRPEDIPLKRMYLFQLGNYYRRNRNYKSADRYYREALELPTDWRKNEIQQALNTVKKRP